VCNEAVNHWAQGSVLYREYGRAMVEPANRQAIFLQGDWDTADAGMAEIKSPDASR
jgi:hypothetical protein